MKRILILFSCIIVIFMPTFLLAYGEDYKLIKITHPELSYENPKPLIIEYECMSVDYNIQKAKIVCEPMIFKDIYFSEDNETIDYRFSYIRYYDAAEKPDKKGFIIYQKRTWYEFNGPIEEIRMYDYSNGYNLVYFEPQGFDLYFSKDGKYLIASDYQQLGEGEPPINVDLYYYDMMGKKEKHFKKVRIKYEDLKKFNLIPLR